MQDISQANLRRNRTEKYPTSRHFPSQCCSIDSQQRRRKEDEAAGAANQKGDCNIGELTHKFPNLFPAFLRKILILPICRILINSFYLYLKESQKLSFDKVGGHLQKLNRSKV